MGLGGMFRPAASFHFHPSADLSSAMREEPSSQGPPPPVPRAIGGACLHLGVKGHSAQQTVKSLRQKARPRTVITCYWFPVRLETCVPCFE